MIHLNNKHALDGRKPNSYSGIFGALGRYDRPYMSLANTARKAAVKGYIQKYSEERSARRTTPFLR
jgi:deoxyribodipyrimidine photo-lyase